MVKKLCTLLTCLLLCLPLAASAEMSGFDDLFQTMLQQGNPSATDAPVTQAPAAPVASRQVIDDAGVLTAQKIMEISAVIDGIEAEHQVDVVVLITRDVPDDPSEELWRVQAWADGYYENGGFGMGGDFSGILYMIDLNNRVQWISTEGVMIRYITDSREEAILDAAEYYLYRSDWGGAALAAVRCIGAFMEEGQERGNFLYDEVTGERLTGYYNPLEMHEILIALAGGAGVALVLCGSVSAAYNLKGSTYRYDLARGAETSGVEEEQQFLRESVSRMARSTGSGGSSFGGGGGGRSGGSGVHRSSSGRSHGGGGRRF